jgi:hypothetical protein
MTTSTDDFTVTVDVTGTPDEAFAAIADPRAWWSRDITGDTDRLGGEFEFEVPGIHYSHQRVSTFDPGESVVWDVVDARMTFIADQTEWIGTSIRFDLQPLPGGGTEIRFSHVGLRPQIECYDACSTAWTSYVTTSLRRLVEQGVGLPNQEEAAGDLAGLAERLKKG